MTFREAERRLDTLLREAGCKTYTARRALADVSKSWSDVRQEQVARGGSGEDPFFTFVAAEGAGVFAIHLAGVLFYVIRGDERDFRRFGLLAIDEVGHVLGDLAYAFGRLEPDLIIVGKESARAWLSSYGDATSG